MISEIVSCGNDVVSPQCRFCPKPKVTGLNKWCDGKCEIDESTGTCQDKGIYVSIFGVF